MSTKLHHRLPLGTKVTFEGDAQIYIVDQYTNLLGPCGPGCIDHDGDCYCTPHITVRKESWSSKPLIKLKYIFDPITHHGREATTLERTPIL